MNDLKLPNPKLIDVVVQANMRVGLHQEEIARRGWSLSARDAIAGLAAESGAEIALIDLREQSDRERHRSISGALHMPYATLQEDLAPGGLLHALARSPARPVVFYCAFGERSAMAVQAAQDVGLSTVRHIEGGLDA